MSQDPIAKLVDGYARFRDQYYAERRERFQALLKGGQKPRIALIACSDSRIDPAVVLGVEPGELFVVRNVAALVPPCESGGTYHGTSAALEFAVNHLKVSEVIVFGHAHCGGIRSLVEGADAPPATEFVSAWTSIVGAAYRRVLATQPHASIEVRQRACEQNAVLVSLENLTTFPFIRERLGAGSLRLHGWYFDLGTAELFRYDPLTSRFEPLA